MPGTFEHPPEEEVELVRDTIETEQGTVSFGRITPEAAPSGKPVIFLPGYGEGIGTVTPVSKKIANAHSGTHTHETFVVGHARWDFALSLKDIKKLYPDAPPAALALGVVMLRRAHEAILVLDHHKAKAHLVGHSLGGMTAVAVALLRPDLVESLVLVNSAGIGPKVHWTRLFGRFVRNWGPELKKHGVKMIPVILRTLFVYMSANPLRALRENWKAADTDMTSILTELGRKGVKITIVRDKLDKVFPSEEIDAQLALAGGDNPPFKVEKTEDDIHFGPVMSPNKYGRFISKILDDIEAGQ